MLSQPALLSVCATKRRPNTSRPEIITERTVQKYNVSGIDSDLENNSRILGKLTYSTMFTKRSRCVTCCLFHEQCFGIDLSIAGFVFRHFISICKLHVS